MRPAVKIDDLTDSLAMVSPESAAWLDRETGRVWIIANSADARRYRIFIYGYQRHLRLKTPAQAGLQKSKL